MSTRTIWRECTCSPMPYGQRGKRPSHTIRLKGKGSRQIRRLIRVEYGRYARECLMPYRLLTSFRTSSSRLFFGILRLAGISLVEFLFWGDLIQDRIVHAHFFHERLHRTFFGRTQGARLSFVTNISNFCTFVQRNVCKKPGTAQCLIPPLQGRCRCRSIPHPCDRTGCTQNGSSTAEQHGPIHRFYCCYGRRRCAMLIRHWWFQRICQCFYSRETR